MNVEHVEKGILSLMAIHQIGHMVALFRDKSTLRVRCFSSGGTADDIAVKAIGEFIEKHVQELQGVVTGALDGSLKGTT